MSNITKFDTVLMESAQVWAKLSKGKIQVGAVISVDNHIVSHGYNGLVSGGSNTLEGSEGATKPDVIHAEENALIFCARKGIACDGAALYCSYMPCSHCAALIVQAGISKVYYLNEHTSRTKGRGYTLLKHSGIIITRLK